MLLKSFKQLLLTLEKGGREMPKIVYLTLRAFYYIISTLYNIIYIKSLYNFLDISIYLSYIKNRRKIIKQINREIIKTL